MSVPAPKRLIIESHEGGTYSITSTRSSSDSSAISGDFQDGQSDAGTESEASPDLRDAKEHSHSEKSSGTLVSCYA